MVDGVALAAFGFKGIDCRFAQQAGGFVIIACSTPAFEVGY